MTLSQQLNVVMYDEEKYKSSLIFRAAVVMRPLWRLWYRSAGDSPSAGIWCVYTLSAVTVIGLGLVSLKIWERTIGYGASYVCESVKKTESEKREKETTRETPLQFNLHWFFKFSQ